jgi:tripartite-type tricarboxylate transporter receptor subunit TctC
MKSWPLLIAAGLATVLLAAAAAAQTYPGRPIRLVVPFPPGTASDFLGRTIGAGLTDLYKMQVVVDNRPGAGGLVGTPIVLQATPDGHTLGLFAPPYLTSPMLQKKEPYRSLQDGVPVVQVAGIPNVIGISLGLPAKTLKEFIAYARSRPGELNYASVGVGSISHLSAEILNGAAGIKTVHVPFKLLADAWTEIFSGRVHLFVFTGPSSVPMVKDGRVRALAVSTAKRISALPDVPTVSEAGLPAAEHTAWFGVFVPAGTPQALVNRLATDVKTVLRDPLTRQRFETQGAEVVDNSSPEAFATLVRAEHTRFAKLIKDAGIQAQ